MEITGILKVKMETQVVSDRFKKRSFVLKTEASTPYPQLLEIQLTQDKVSLLDQYNEGDEIKVQFNLRGREWNGPNGIKYFNTLEAWRIEKVGGNSQSNVNNSTPTFTGNMDNDDLPF